MPPARLALVAAAVLFSAAPASAQLFEIARSSQPLNVAFSANAAFDPAHDCYFVVTREPAVTGHFIDRFGNIIGTVAFDPRGGPYVSRVTYSPDVSDGAGGHGGFVVIFTLESAVVAQIVSFPGRLVGPPVPIYGGPTDPVFIIKADIAYSPVDRGFLVALARVKEGLFPTNVPAVLVWLDLDAHPIRQTTLSSDPDFSCFNLEFFDECSEVGVAWNPISAEYGVLYTQGSEKALALVRSDGAILTRMALGIGTRFGALAVNTSTGNYLAVGAGGNLGECCDPKTDAAEVDPGGNFVARGAVTSTLQTGSATHALMGLSYLPASGTFLLVGLGGTGGTPALTMLELNQHGVVLPPSLVDSAPSFALVASHATAREWLVGGAGVPLIVGSATPFGGSDTRLDGCSIPDPFVSLGGGICLNGGWLPPGMDVPPPPPNLCTIPDPFVSLGGGTCVNGGWLPPGMGTPGPPPPPPPPPVCTTPDPFVSIGGGVCVQGGGWVPKGHPLAGSGSGG